jgi:C4-dicarboxylate-specific signal transduction histidine kinase
MVDDPDETHERQGNHYSLRVRHEGSDGLQCAAKCRLPVKIFSRQGPFFTTKSKASGTGLGFYICHNLSQGLGGTIAIESEPGKGSIFRLALAVNDQK